MGDSILRISTTDSLPRIPYHGFHTTDSIPRISTTDSILRIPYHGFHTTDSLPRISRTDSLHGFCVPRIWCTHGFLETSYYYTSTITLTSDDFMRELLCSNAYILTPSTYSVREY